MNQDEATRLLNSCQPDFRQLAHAALITGCRYGELTRLKVRDYQAEASAISILDAKSGKSRHVFLNDEGVRHFEQLTAGRPKSHYLFLRADGEPWRKSHQARRIKEASQIAGIDPPISFHILRHSYSSFYLMAGGSLPALAAQLGHYGHLAEHWRADEAHRFSPSFGGPPTRSVVARLRTS